MAQRPLNLIWRHKTLDFVLEGYFIKEVLLAGLRRPVRQLVFEDNESLTLESDMLIVTLGTEAADYLRAAASRSGRTRD